jgi:hypothetical protein
VTGYRTKALGELALISEDFPLAEPVTIGCGDKATLSLCKDHKKGQGVKLINIIHHLEGSCGKWEASACVLPVGEHCEL